MFCGCIVTLVLAGIIPALIYLFLTWNFGYWKKRGVKGPKPMPLTGSFPSFFTQKRNIAYDLDDIYNVCVYIYNKRQYKKDENYVGIFTSRSPDLLILNPELAHQVYVTNFKNFHDNEMSLFIDNKKDLIFSNNPFVLTGGEWKERRTEITPGLTNIRVKSTYPVTQQVCKNLCDHIREQSKVATKGGIDGKELCLSYTTEVVSDCVLGIKAGNFTPHPTPIKSMIQKLFDQSYIFTIYSILYGFFPIIRRFYVAKFFPQESENFFLNLMKTSIDLRRKEKIDRTDFLNYLLQLQEKKNLTTTELASHTMTFLVDGFETTAGVIAHCLLLIARHPEIQNILLEEILKNSDSNGEVNFEILMDLPYLDACLQESIRLFSPLLFARKVCTEPFEFTNKNGRDKVKVNVGTKVVIPVYSFHHDGDYYPEPQNFKPERFLPENGGAKKYREMGVYLAFGDGPRICLGMRFAHTQAKAAIVEIVRNFVLKVNPRTRKDDLLNATYFMAMLDGGIWLDFEERNK